MTYVAVNTTHHGGVNHSRVLGWKPKDWRTQIFLFLLAEDYDFERERGIFMYAAPTCVRCTLHREYLLCGSLLRAFGNRVNHWLHLQVWQPRPSAITTRLEPSTRTQFWLWPPSSSSIIFFITKEALTNKPWVLILVYHCRLVAPERLPSRLRSQVSTPVSSASVRPSTELGAKESQYRHFLTERADCTSEHLHRPRSATRCRPLSLSTQGRHKVVGRKLNSPSWLPAKKWVAGRKMSCSL